MAAADCTAPEPADPGLWARVDGWIGRARLEQAAWAMLEGAEERLKPDRGETALRLLGFFVMDAVEQLAAVLSPAWTAEALRDLAGQAEDGRTQGFSL